MKIILSKKYVAVVITTIAAFVLMLVVKPQPAHFVKVQGEVWTTSYHITYQTRNASLADSIDEVLWRIDMSASAFNKESLVSQINQNRTNRVDDTFKQLYFCALNICEQSEGAYDPTVKPLVNAWGFGEEETSAPSAQQIDSIREFVGIRKTSLNNSLIAKTDGRVQFDFSSIAKGLACDEVARMLARNGVENYLVEIGGEVVARGVNEEAKIWRVAIDAPAETHQKALVVSPNQQFCAIATSGNYRRYREENGRRVSHIVNPRTGSCQVSPLLSVTVLAADCMHADAWATACMVMGLDAVKTKFAKSTHYGIITISTDDRGNYQVWSNPTAQTLLSPNP